ncbi:MAG: cobalt ECF transporter T component CbiQ [Candidatus Omnitrophica bacterium]|nr:cobalt ECF transporter T component CbiQ [Candidatus Omnitrophota bacterium]
MRNNSSRFIERSITGALSFLRNSVFADDIALQKGYLQARDPRIRAAGIGVLLLAVLFARSALFLSSAYLLCLLLAAASSIHTMFFLKRTWLFIPAFAFFIAIPALFNFFTPGEPLISLGHGVSITEQGLHGAVIFFTRVLTSVSLAVLLSLTTRHSVLLRVLRIFKIPQVFVMTLGMSYRYIYLFIETVQNTFTAIKSRVGHVSSVRKGQRAVAWNIASLWLRSYQLQNQIFSAMLSRGYTGEALILYEFRAGAKDFFWLGVTIAVFVFGLWTNRYLH